MTDRIAVVLNGNAKSVTHEIIDLLDQIVFGGDLFVSRSLEEGVEIAKTLVFRGYGTVLTGGGDGTFVHVVTQVVREAKARGVKPPRFGFLRLGTGNALAWVVGASAPRRGIGVAADIARLRTDAGYRPMRLLEVDDFLTPFAGVGLDATVLTQYNRTKKALASTPLKRFAPGPLGYFLAVTTQTLPGYLFSHVPRMTVINAGAPAYRIGPDGGLVGAPVEKGEVIFEGPAKMVACSTIPTYGFGLKAFPFAEDKPDRMQMRIINVSPLQIPHNILKIWKGTFHDTDRMFDCLVERVTVRASEPVPLQIGGDPVGSRSEVTFSLSEPIELVDFYAPSPLQPSGER